MSNEYKRKLIAANHVRGELAHALEHIVSCDYGTKLCPDCERLAKAALEADKMGIAHDEYGWYEDDIEESDG